MPCEVTKYQTGCGSLLGQRMKMSAVSQCSTKFYMLSDIVIPQGYQARESMRSRYGTFMRAWSRFLGMDLMVPLS